MDASARPASLLWVLVRVNLTQSWRRLLALRQQSHLLTLLIAAFMGAYLTVAFWLFLKGLSRLAHFPGIGSMLVERLVYLMFAMLFVLLLLSNLVIGYTNFFRNRETHTLLALPVPASTIFQWKFIESTLLASWAFLFLIAPFMAAYGLTHHVRWHFYPVTVVLLALFLVLPAVGASWLALLFARYVERKTFQVAALAVALGLLVAVGLWLKPEPPADQLMETRVLTVLDRVLVKTHLVQFPFLPSYWLAGSLLQWQTAVSTAAFFVLVLVSNVLFFGAISFTAAGRPFYSAFSAVQSRANLFGPWDKRVTFSRRAAAEPNGVERVLALAFWLPADVRAVVVKDLRLFWRDTTQWAQTLVLFGLLGVYILNLRHFALQSDQPFWVHLVSHLNLAACSLNLATLTTRFIYPQFSLEGRRLWIVGMAPLGLERIVRIKFNLALTAAMTVTISLIWLSSHMLGLPASRTIYFTAAVGVMSFTLTALAVGLGVLYPNLREENPTKIVSGFGGTFCLVLSFLYILASVILLAFGTPWARPVETSFWRVLLSLGAFATLSVLLGWLPLQLALRRMAHFEV